MHSPAWLLPLSTIANLPAKAVSDAASLPTFSGVSYDRLLLGRRVSTSRSRLHALDFTLLQHEISRRGGTPTFTLYIFTHLATTSFRLPLRPILLRDGGSPPLNR